MLDRALIGLAEGAPTDVFIRVRAMGGPSEHPDSSLQKLLADMYAAWAQRRGMRLEQLVSTDDEHVLAVSGLGCSTILTPEAGLHVLEIDDGRDGKRVERETATVDVVAWEPRPTHTPEELLASAESALRGAPTNPSVVRRYRLRPDPLVRDSVRGYRTERVERVLAGDFDLF
ncbi:MAG: hypothetical protein M3364_03660 [Actinomycetota bacterium]|nr:hypothetical protein [Actinomycetota bacterium]